MASERIKFILHHTHIDKIYRFQKITIANISCYNVLIWLSMLKLVMWLASDVMAQEHYGKFYGNNDWFQ